MAAVYSSANRYFNLDHPTDETDQISLELFQKIIDNSKINSGCTGSRYLFNAYLKKGILLEVKGDYRNSCSAYLFAYGMIQNKTFVDDSLSFRVSVYLGSAYYQLNKFDSAQFFLNHAEKVIYQSAAIADQARLFNIFGVLYYDNGNFKQGKNYFVKALEIILKQPTPDQELAENLRTNIATADLKLGNYAESLKEYKVILKSSGEKDVIHFNMARVNSAMLNHRDALQNLLSINAVRLPGVYNELGMTYLKLGSTDSARYFLDKFCRFAVNENNKVNVLEIGTNKLNFAYLHAQNGELMQGLASVQDALVCFSSNFTSRDIFQNPSSFTGSFAYVRLLEALVCKAKLLNRVYDKTKKIKYLKASLTVYQCTIEYLAYVEKNYDTDDAKLLLKRNSREVYEDALGICLKLHAVTNSKEYIEQGFLIVESNRGSVLNSNIRELSISENVAGTGVAAQEIRNLKFAIARLNVNVNGADRSAMLKMMSEKNGYELALAKATKLLESNKDFYKSKYKVSTPSVKTVQQGLMPGQVLISYYSLKDTLYGFVLDRENLSYVTLGSVSIINQHLSHWLKQLHNVESGRSFGDYASGKYLYDALVGPLTNKLKKAKALVIIPDGKISALPFESLPIDGDPTGMLQTFSISYLFSSEFLIRQQNETALNRYSVLSFAPFSTESGKSTDLFVQSLPGSAVEIAALHGQQFTGIRATREAFLQNADRYEVIHLATHAVGNPENPSASYLAFYPGSQDRNSGRIYLEELYGLKLNKTRLVILSACETGEGELASNEGVMSISRGFAYTGVASSINSLWKADDRATSKILQEFHKLLAAGYSRVEALRLAKLQYINATEFGKTPNYWANLVLTGDTTALCEKKPFSFIGLTGAAILGSIILVILIWFLKTKKPKKTGTWI